MGKPEVSIVILNYKAWEDTIACLESLFCIDYPNYEIIVVDNGSGNDSIDKIESYLAGDIQPESGVLEFRAVNKPVRCLRLAGEDLQKEVHGVEFQELNKLPSDKKLILIENRENLGFAGGNNVGINFVLRRGRARYINLLNNDTLVEKDYLTRLVEVLEGNHDFGIAGPKIYKYPEIGRIWAAGGNFRFFFGVPKHIGENSRDSERFNRAKEVTFLSACCELVKTEVFQKVGLLPEEYFLYYEDADFCYRVGKHFRLYYNPEARIYHKEGKSTEKEFQLYLINRNRWRLIFKNFRAPYIILPVIGTIMSLLKNFILFSLRGQFNLSLALFRKPVGIDVNLGKHG